MKAQLGFILSVFFALHFNIAAASDLSPGWTLYTETQNLSLSESTPIYDLIKDFENFNSDGDTAFTHNHAEIGARYQKGKNTWGIAAISRYDHVIDYSTETAELIYLSSNELPVKSDQEYQLFLRTNQLRSNGVKFSFARGLSEHMSARIDLAWLAAKVLSHGLITGEVLIDSSNNIGGQAHIDYSYDQDEIFDRNSDGTKGTGYSIDVSLDWRPVDILSVQLQLKDLANELNFDRTAFTKAVINTATTSLDSDGLLNVVPVLSGVEDYRPHRHRLAQRNFLEAELSLTNHWQINTKLMNINSTTLREIGAGYRINDQHRVGIAVNADTGALRFGYQNRLLSFSVTSDSPDYAKAQHFGFNGALSLRF